jgi:omega-amidase
MKVYCVQLNIHWEQKTTNFERVEMLLKATPPQSGSLVLLPEMFATGFSMNLPAVREGRGRETETFLSGLSKKLDVFVEGGLVTGKLDGRGSNQAVVYSQKGIELARYTKLQPFTHGGEAEHYEAGTGGITFSWNSIKVAPFICYDLRFPEHFRQAARSRPELMTVIANWPVGRIQHWVTLLQARAIENQCYVAGVNRCGADPKLTYSGRSMIVGPKGDVLADAGNGECVICADLDLETLATYRREVPFLADQR